jgi:hypothetical protein
VSDGAGRGRVTRNFLRADSVLPLDAIESKRMADAATRHRIGRPGESTKLIA